jgi:hypothetical protein
MLECKAIRNPNFFLQREVYYAADITIKKSTKTHLYSYVVITMS